MFSSFRELYGIFTRITQEESMKTQLRINRNRTARTLEPGETVFRKLPFAARLLPAAVFFLRFAGVWRSAAVWG